MNSNKAIYNTIGATYSLTRKADRRILDKLNDKLQLNELGSNARIIDVGAGSGNYTIAVANLRKDLRMTGVEPSEIMISQARQNCIDQNVSENVEFVQAFSDDMPFEDNTFDCMTSILAIHHFENLPACIEEMVRVVKPGGRIVILTADPSTKENIWIEDYFGFLVETTYQVYMPMDNLVQILKPYADGNVDVDKMLLPADMEDLFFLSGWARPELYLKEEVRAGISHFAKASQIPEKVKLIEESVALLNQDLNSGLWNSRYGKNIEGKENYDGGYRVVSFKKMTSI